MSDQIPFEIQVEIIKRLPIKSLIRFRSVSKPWKSLIDSSKFIADYRVPNSQSQRLLVSYRVSHDSELEYVLIDDDDTFPQRKCSLNVPMFVNLIEVRQIIGSSHGLLCLYGNYREGNRGLRVVVLWNPSIQKSVAIKVPNELDLPYETVVGFGVCPNTNHPKLVKINFISLAANLEDISCIPFQVEVFTLSSMAWRVPLRNLPRKSINFISPHIVIDGFIYWLAFDMTFSDDFSDYFEGYYLIVSFDLTSEEFSEIYFPDNLSQQYSMLSIYKLKDSLVVLEESGIGLEQLYCLWSMEHGVPNSFTKLFTFHAPYAVVLGFRESGEPLLKIEDDNNNDRFKTFVKLEVYEPSSKHTKDLEIYGDVNSFFVSSYMETLILLDQPDCSTYSNMQLI